MIYFGIPLRSAQVSNDWCMVSKLFNRTLWSVYNQTCSEFKVIIACHEIPMLEKKYDDRVEFIQVEAPVPRNKHEMMIDKGQKIHSIAMRIRRYGGGYTMMVDADDIQSCRIAAYVKEHKDENGFVSKNGYYYHVGDNYVKMGHKFPNGSSTIVNYSIEDLPDRYYSIPTPNENTNPHICRKRHGDIPKFCTALGRELSTLPFIASIYVRDTGDNHSLMGTHESVFRILEQSLMPKKYISDELRQEFSIDWM